MKKKLIILLFPLFAICFQSIAQGDLLITPMRVVFEGNKQKAELNLVNIGTDTATYSVSFKQYNMTELGNLVVIEKPDSTQLIAEPYLRIFPRQVTLSPGESQTIMLQCRRKPNMLAGEYRSHIWFRGEKNYKALGKDEPVLDSNQLSVKLIPIFGITIPVIIRSGEVNVIIALSDLKLETLQDTMHTLKLVINRKGNISVYGNIIVEYIPVQGKPIQIGIVKGVGVYTSINKRNVIIKLNTSPGISLNNGKLLVKYISSDEKKPAVYAVGELELK
jgi:hypothetical protein